MGSLDPASPPASRHQAVVGAAVANGALRIEHPMSDRRTEDDERARSTSAAAGAGASGRAGDVARLTQDLQLEDVFPRARLLGRCHDCRRPVLDVQPHDWADPDSDELRLPLAPGAALFCGRCADARG